MKYTRSIGDIYEIFEGTPEEIAELIMRMPEKLEVGETVDEDEMVDFIYNNARLELTTELRYAIKKILDLESEYLKQRGIKHL